MIQELLGGGSATPPTGFFGERKISIPFSSSSTCPSTTPLLTTTNTIIVMNTPNSSNTGSSTGGGSGVATANNNNNNNNSSETNNNSSQNLRCPRCDSTNTKFCYYNNYNLTQPRHFCKTCRRYWTKGGTLRNVPIGGGCRKNKPTISSSSASSAAMSKSSTPTHHHFMAKAKANLSSEMLVNENNSSLFLGNGLLDHPLQTPGPSPILWPSFPQAQNSHIMALLRGGSTPFSNPNLNPNPNPNSNPSTTTTSSVFTSLGLDSYGHNNGAPSLLGSFTRSNQNQLNGFGPDFGENNNGGGNILDLYQRLKSSSNYGYCGGNENPGAVILGNMLGSSTSSMSSTILDATPLSAGGGGDHMGGGYGFMNTSPAISSWSDFPAVPINGAYP